MFAIGYSRDSTVVMFVIGWLYRKHKQYCGYVLLLVKQDKVMWLWLLLYYTGDINLVMFIGYIGDIIVVIFIVNTGGAASSTLW